MPCAAWAGDGAPEPTVLDIQGIEVVSPNLMRIPFTLTGTLITVRATVDTLEGNFIFDTGASELLLNSRYFNGEMPALASVGTAMGVTGIVKNGLPYYADAFQWDGLLASNIRLQTLDLSHVERAKKLRLLGLIGYEVFRDFEVIFDYALQQLVLIRVDKTGKRLEELSEGEYVEASSFPITIAHHVAVVELHFGEKYRMSFGIDSGAEQNLIDHWASSKFLKAHVEILRRIKLNGTGSEQVEVLSGMLRGGRLGDIALAPMATLITDLTHINDAYGTQLDGILGYEFMHQQPMGINFRKHVLTLYVQQ